MLLKGLMLSLHLVQGLTWKWGWLLAPNTMKTSIPKASAPCMPPGFLFCTSAMIWWQHLTKGVSHKFCTDTSKFIFFKEHFVLSLSGPWSNANNYKQQQAWAVEQGYRWNLNKRKVWGCLSQAWVHLPGKSMFENSSFLKHTTPLRFAKNKRIFAHWCH